MAGVTESAALRMMQAHAEPKRVPDAAVSKPTNPKDSAGILKSALSVVPLPVLLRVALGMLEGALKYGRHNYRVIGVRGSVYFDATVRHLFAWWEGEDLDPESHANLHHIDKAISSLVVMRDAILQGKFTDDRPPPSPKGWMDEINGSVKALLAKFPDPVAQYWASGRGPGRQLEQG